MVDPSNPGWKVSSKLRANARSLRRNSTDAERILWSELRDHRPKRSAVIEAKGFQVLRFSNRDVVTNRAGVLETISAADAARAPTLTLLRKRGREKEQNPGKADQ